MATKAQVMRAARREGAEITVEGWGSGAVVSAYAPAGKVWVITDTHVVCEEQEPGDATGSALWAAMLDNLEEGTVPCAKQDCDVCHE